MPRCVYCGKLQLLRSLKQGGFCNACNSYEGRISLCKEIIKSTWLSTEESPKYKLFISSLQGNKQKGACIVDILCNYEAPEAWYCIAIAHQLQGAKFRPEQIKYSKKLLDSGYPLEKEDAVYIYNLLADAYEGEYMFEEAIEMRKKLLSAHEDYTPAHIVIARLMVKQNRIDDAIKYLEDVYEDIKRNPYYRFDYLLEKRVLHYNYVGDMKALPIHIKELKDKKERGYVYRPRKKKTKAEGELRENEKGQGAKQGRID